MTRHLTARDEEILVALDRCPLTVHQLLKLSQAFPGQYFTSARSVQDRLQKMREAGWVRSFCYALANHGSAPDYYRLTLLGHRLVHGQNAPVPVKRHFSEVSIGNHHHTKSLADFVVHTLVSAHRRGIRMLRFWPENHLRLTVGQEILAPDCAFELHTQDGRQFNFLVEIDCGTERIRSEKDSESWQRKIRLYNTHQDRVYPNRFRLLIVTTRCGDRLRSILAFGAEHSKNPFRALCYGIHLDAFLREPDAVIKPAFQDHRGRPVPLVPLTPSPLSVIARL